MLRELKFLKSNLDYVVLGGEEGEEETAGPPRVGLGPVRAGESGPFPVSGYARILNTLTTWKHTRGN